MAEKNIFSAFDAEYMNIMRQVQGKPVAAAFFECSIEAEKFATKDFIWTFLRIVVAIFLLGFVAWKGFTNGFLDVTASAVLGGLFLFEMYAKAQNYKVAAAYYKMMLIRSSLASIILSRVAVKHFNKDVPTDEAGTALLEEHRTEIVKETNEFVLKLIQAYEEAGNE